MLLTLKFGAEIGPLSECARGYLSPATASMQKMCLTPKFGARNRWPLFGLPQAEAENVPDAEIRRSNSLKLKFGLPPG